jgi:hypothetical protein
MAIDKLCSISGCISIHDYNITFQMCDTTWGDLDLLDLSQARGATGGRIEQREAVK